MTAGIIARMRSAAREAAATIRLGDGREIPAVLSSIEREHEYDETGVEVGRRGNVYCDASPQTSGIRTGDALVLRLGDGTEETVRVVATRRIGWSVMELRVGARHGR